MSERRSFTAEFKAKVVLEVLSGHKHSAEVCRQYGIGAPLLSTWKATFLEHSAAVFQGDERCSQDEATICAPCAGQIRSTTVRCGATWL